MGLRVSDHVPGHRVAISGGIPKVSETESQRRFPSPVKITLSGRYGFKRVGTQAIVLVFAGVLAFYLTRSIYAGPSRDLVASVSGEAIKKYEFVYYLRLQKNDVLHSNRRIRPEINGTDFWNTVINGESYLDNAKRNTLEKLRDIKLLKLKAKELNYSVLPEELKSMHEVCKHKAITALGNGDKTRTDNIINARYHMSLDELCDIQVEYTFTRRFILSELSKIPLTKGILKNYYESNPEVFKKDTQARKHAEEAVWIHRIFIGVSREASQYVRDAARKEIEAIFHRLKNGEDFTEVSRSVAQRCDTGDYLFGKGKMSPELEYAAFSAAPNEWVDSILATEDGFEIIKVVGKFKKDQPVSLRCAMEYFEYGDAFFRKKIFQKQFDEWKKEPKYRIDINRATYGSLN